MPPLLPLPPPPLPRTSSITSFLLPPAAYRSGVKEPAYPSSPYVVKAVDIFQGPSRFVHITRLVQLPPVCDDVPSPTSAATAATASLSPGGDTAAGTAAATDVAATGGKKSALEMLSLTEPAKVATAVADAEEAGASAAEAEAEGMIGGSGEEEAEKKVVREVQGTENSAVVPDAAAAAAGDDAATEITGICDAAAVSADSAAVGSSDVPNTANVGAATTDATTTPAATAADFSDAPVGSHEALVETPHEPAETPAYPSPAPAPPVADSAADDDDVAPSLSTPPKGGAGVDATVQNADASPSLTSPSSGGIHMVKKTLHVDVRKGGATRRRDPWKLQG